MGGVQVVILSAVQLTIMFIIIVIVLILMALAQTPVKIKIHCAFFAQSLSCPPQVNTGM